MGFSLDVMFTVLTFNDNGTVISSWFFRGGPYRHLQTTLAVKWGLLIHGHFIEDRTKTYDDNAKHIMMTMPSTSYLQHPVFVHVRCTTRHTQVVEEQIRDCV